MVVPSALLSHESTEHYTPQYILDAVITCMGAIDLDPCSNSREIPNVPAARYYTTQDDGPGNKRGRAATGSPGSGCGTQRSGDGNHPRSRSMCIRRRRRCMRGMNSRRSIRRSGGGGGRGLF